MSWIRNRVSGAALAVAVVAGGGGMATLATASPALAATTTCHDAISSVYSEELAEVGAAAKMDALGTAAANNQVISLLATSIAACTDKNINVNSNQYFAYGSFTGVGQYLGASPQNWASIDTLIGAGVGWTVAALGGAGA